MNNGFDNYSPGCVLSAVLVASSMVLAGCSLGSSKDESKRSPRVFSIPEGTDTSQLRFNILSDLRIEEGAERCPLIPQETADTMFSPNHRVLVSFSSNQTEDLSSCLVQKTPEGVPFLLHLEIKKIKHPLRLAFREKETQMGLPDDNPPEVFRSFAGRFPGSGLVGSLHSAWWSCGAMWVALGPGPGRLRPDFPAKGRSHWVDSLQAMGAAIESVCGTVDKPKKDVTDWPHIVWDRYDAVGGTNPESYGVERPAPDPDETYPGP